MSLTSAQAVGQAIQELRREKGLTQEEAALDADVDRAHLSGIERGITSPRVSTIWKIAGTLGVPPSMIFARAELLILNDKRPPRPKP